MTYTLAIPKHARKKIPVNNLEASLGAIVAFIYDDEQTSSTYREVLQAEEKKVK